jgi:lysophospholipase
MEPAPFFANHARFDGPAETAWVETGDGVRIRLGHYAPGGDARGTVLLFPGRTEHIEKYGPTATVLTAAGWAVAVVDWRGQALSTRLVGDPMIGHVDRFTDYQHDAVALARYADALGLPGPRVLLAHSMGGAIGLRAVMDGLAVSACVFSGPMWGIQIAPTLRPVAWAVGAAGHALGLGRRRAPGTTAECYLATGPFEENTLTTDPEMWAWMQGHLHDRPELQLGGPSITWLYEALVECRRLAARPSPALPCLTVFGSEEAIVDPDAIRTRMARWPTGRLSTLHGKRHEVMMDDAETRASVLGAALALFDEATA